MDTLLPFSVHILLAGFWLKCDAEGASTSKTAGNSFTCTRCIHSGGCNWASLQDLYKLTGHWFEGSYATHSFRMSMLLLLRWFGCKRLCWFSGFFVFGGAAYTRTIPQSGFAFQFFSIKHFIGAIFCWYWSRVSSQYILILNYSPVLSDFCIFTLLFDSQFQWDI